jgi:hypothetical protein
VDDRQLHLSSSRLGSLVHAHLLLTERFFVPSGRTVQYPHWYPDLDLNLNRRTDLIQSGYSLVLNVRNNDDVFDHAMSIVIRPKRFHGHHPNSSPSGSTTELLLLENTTAGFPSALCATDSKDFPYDRDTSRDKRSVAQYPSAAA